MSPLRKVTALACALMLLALISSCSNNPVSSNGDAGNLTLSIRGLGDASAGKGPFTMSGGDRVTLTSARVVIEKVELENDADASFDFKFDQPFVQDLLLITSLQQIQAFQVPFGTYDKVKVSIDDLDAQDGDVFTQNPELQNLSIRVEGFAGEDTADTFVFTSDIALDINVEFSPPIVIDEMTVNRNLMIDIDYGSWFVDRSGRLIDPTQPGSQERIERNIQNSLKVFRDDDRDGKEDDDESEIKAPIDSLGVDFLIAGGQKVFVTDDTRIVRYGHGPQEELSFADLAVGMEVKIHARLRDDGTLVAIKIKVENEDDDNGDDDQVYEASAAIDSLGADFLVIAGTTIFVNDDTNILSGNHSELTFADLQVGMRVSVRAVVRDDGTLLATDIKVKVEPDHQEVVEIRAQIDSLGADYFVAAATKIFVDDDTLILQNDDGHDHSGDKLEFSDLQVGMLIEVRAVLRDDGTLVATKIMVK
jgi:hypothetical protein